MSPILASRPNAYTGSPLDRAAHRRDDAAWIAAALADPGTRWAPVWGGRVLVAGAEAGRPEAAFVTGEVLAALRPADAPWAFLGVDGSTPLFALDASAADDPGPRLSEGSGVFTELRSVAGALPAGQAAILAHARALMHWRARHRFCANCGAQVEPRHSGNTTLCPACATQHFPRTDPAVIMLVTHAGRAMLAHSPRFPVPRMYSTLAGFVEPGESLEEAVAREVFEEAGVRVARVTYHSSQPWPFPASVMLGFYAEALDEAIVIDDDEIADARWFSRDEVRRPEAHGFCIPGGDSIARRLIDDWVDAG